MQDFPPFVYETLAQLPPEQEYTMRVLAEQDRTLFWGVILKMRKYDRIQKTGNLAAWREVKQEAEKELTTLDL